MVLVVVACGARWTPAIARQASGLMPVTTLWSMYAQGNDRTEPHHDHARRACSIRIASAHVRSAGLYAYPLMRCSTSLLLTMMERTLKT